MKFICNFKYRDDFQKTHPCLAPFDHLPPEEKQYDSKTAVESLKSLLSFGYYIGMEVKTDDRRLKYIKLSNSYVQSNGYKPQPLDLSNINLSSKMDDLIEILAENTHNVWAAGRIKDGFTYGVSDVSRLESGESVSLFLILTTRSNIQHPLDDLVCCNYSSSQKNLHTVLCKSLSNSFAH